MGRDKLVFWRRSSDTGNYVAFATARGTLQAQSAGTAFDDGSVFVDGAVTIERVPNESWIVKGLYLTAVQIWYQIDAVEPRPPYGRLCALSCTRLTEVPTHDVPMLAGGGVLEVGEEGARQHLVVPRSDGRQ